MGSKEDVIRKVLSHHPDYESFEQVQAECANRGTEVGLWSVYFVAKSIGRNLERRPIPNSEEVIRDVALTLIGLHRSADDAVATLRKVKNRNENDERIPWETEKTAPTETWELSVAQELLDLCDGELDVAITAVVRR